MGRRRRQKKAPPPSLSSPFLLILIYLFIYLFYLWVYLYAGQRYVLFYIDRNVSHETQISYWGSLLLPFVFTAENHVLPVVMSLFGALESWTPTRRIWVTFARAVGMRIVTGGCYWSIIVRRTGKTKTKI